MTGVNQAAYRKPNEGKRVEKQLNIAALLNKYLEPAMNFMHCCEPWETKDSGNRKYNKKDLACV